MLKRRYKILLWIVGIWAFAMVLNGPGMLRACQQKKAVNQTFSAYATALVSKQFEEAYRYCSRDFQEATSFQAFVSLHQELQSRYGNLNSVKQKGSVVEGRGSPARWAAVIKADHMYQAKSIRF